MNSKLELFLIGLFIFAVYWFVLRKYNSLGLRMLFLCSLLFVGCCTWIYKDEVALKNTIANGEEHTATIISKSVIEKSKDNEVEVSFTASNGQRINTKTSKYISVPEWQQFEAGKPVTVLYVPNNKQTFVQQSLLRFKADKIFLYYFAGFWLLLGVVLYFWLRKYKVGVDEKGNEWLERNDGRIFLDERTSGFYRAAKKGNIVSKLLQSFAK